ncbi:unnamed protein product [Rhizophagus irregularis]|uniref:Protein kinase domain-containing protein n=1 Tax=Rhizophagus irregularis TaxID=588596 RepID=A0A915ZZ74_9GLOM|nr:unnamed protein product [Rhizophagus irregularis]CAB5392849.1 unnamed protein product [Rhizophagus irregularis]
MRLQRDIQFHSNIINFYGITKFEPENHNDQLKKYLLVMEFADSGTLHEYLKNNFSNLTWDDKYKLAYQLTSAVSCLHNEGIVHRDLHSGNILVHQGEEYDVDLAIDIKEGLREETVPGTPENYVNLYTECWDGEPTNRPTIYQVIESLKVIMGRTDMTSVNHPIINPLSSNNQETNSLNVNSIASSINNSFQESSSSSLSNEQIIVNEIIHKKFMIGY